MASYIWSASGGGNWSDPANWSSDGVPGPSDQALIDLAGSCRIALDVAAIGSLTLDAAGVTVTPTGSLTLGGTIDVKAGTLTVAHTIQGGTLVADGGTIDYAGGTLDGVTLSGPLDLGAAGSSLTIEGGIGFTGPGQGQILDTGAGSALTMSGGQTLNDVAVTVGNGAGTAHLAAGALTLAADSSLTVIGSKAISFTSLDNQGTLSVVDDGSFQLQNVTNAGTVELSGSTVSELGMANAGLLVLSNGTHLATGLAAFSNAGTIVIDPTSSLEIDTDVTLAQLGGIVDEGGTLTIRVALDLGGSTVDLTAGNPAASGYQLHGGTIQDGTIETDGTGVHYTGTYNVLSDVTIDGTLDVDGGTGTELDIENGFGFGGAGPGRIVETTAGSFVQFIGSRTLDDVQITLGGSYLDVTGTLTLGPASTVTLAANTTFGSPDGVNIQTDVLDNQGTIIAAAGGLASVTNDATGNVLQNDGLFAASAGSVSSLYNLVNAGTLSVSGAASVTVQMLANSGIVDISDGGSVVVTAQVGDHKHVGLFDSTGTVEISGGGTLTLQDGASELGTISFGDHAGTLVLADLSYYEPFVAGSTDGTLNLFQSGDALDLGDVDTIASGPPQPFSLSHQGNTLSVYEGTTLLDGFALTGQDYSNATFTLTGDVVTTDAPCFCAGTLILTDRGERAVEALEVGELVVTVQDGVRTLMPIRWLGRRRVVVAQHVEPEHVDPVRIARDAIAPELPVRDLFVSPDHALHLDGVLIQARQLVNHMTITRDSGRTSVTYHHVELDRHAVLIADGMPCESYLDGGNRGQFDAQGSVVALHPPAVGDAQPCAPLVTDAALVQPIWQRLADRARAGGHVPPMPELEGDLLPWLETADGVPLVPSGDGRHFVLPAGCLRVRLRSRSDRPTTLAPWSDDRRRLGVAISGLTLCQGRWRQELALASLRDEAGWWPLETASGLGWRWTDGNGWIVLPDPAEAIEIALHAVLTIIKTLAARPGYAAAG